MWLSRRTGAAAGSGSSQPATTQSNGKSSSSARDQRVSFNRNRGRTVDEVRRFRRVRGGGRLGQE